MVTFINIYCTCTCDIHYHEYNNYYFIYFQKLNAMDIPDPQQYTSATLSVNKDKNRFPDVLPCKLI